MNEKEFACVISLDKLPSRTYVVSVTIVSVAVVVAIFTSMIAFSQVSIGGQDASSQMKDVQTIITTIQTIGFKWVAPLIGGGLCIMGIFQISTRRLATGLLALGGGGALFAVERIAASLSHIAGN